MVDISIVNGSIKPTYNWGAQPCIDMYLLYLIGVSILLRHCGHLKNTRSSTCSAYDIPIIFVFIPMFVIHFMSTSSTNNQFGQFKFQKDNNYINSIQCHIRVISYHINHIKSYHIIISIYI